jgi:hypothetical protein
VVLSGAGSLDADLKNVPVINWITKAAREAEFIMSHYQGAFLLGKAGVLDKSSGTVTCYKASLYGVEQLFGKDEALTVASALIFGPSNPEAAMAIK